MTLVLILALASLLIGMAVFASALSIDGEPIHILALALCSKWAGFILGYIMFGS